MTMCTRGVSCLLMDPHKMCPGISLYVILYDPFTVRAGIQTFFAPLFPLNRSSVRMQENHQYSSSSCVDLGRGICHCFYCLVTISDSTQLFKLLFSSEIGHDPPCFLCSHDLCLFLFLMFHSSHDHMAKRSHYRIMIFSTSEYY